MSLPAHLSIPRLQLGPSIGGTCREVSPDVYTSVTDSTVERPTPVDLRTTIADRAPRLGVRSISMSEWCTRCSNEQLFSHRAGDVGRQLGVVLKPDRRK